VSGRPEPAPHTERWAYRRLYRAGVFGFCTRLYPVLGRAGFRLVAGAVARAFAATQPTVVETVARNLRLIAPRASAADAAGVFAEFARVIADYTALGARPPGRAREWLGKFSGREFIEGALAGGGAILATGHYGFFEFGAVAMAMEGYRITVATAPEPNPELTKWRADWRGRWGIETVEVGEDPFASMGILDALGQGRLVALLADRPMSGHGVDVGAAGGRVAFSLAPALLARTARVPLIPVVVSAGPDDRYDLTALPGIRVERRSHENRRNEIAGATTAVGHSLLERFAANPREWFQFAPL